MAVEEGMKRVFFSQSLPQALTRDSQPGWLAGSREGPRLREGKPHGAQLQQTRRRRRRRGARRLRAAAPRAAAAAAPGEASSAVSPDEQVPLTLWLSTRTRTRKTGRAPARGGAERGWAGGAQLPLVLLLLLLMLLRLLPRSPPPMGSACSGGSSGDADQTPGRKWTTCCSPQTCCCLPLPCVFIYFSSQRSYLGRDPIPFSPEVSLLKPYWTQSFFPPLISNFSSLLNCLGLCHSLPLDLRFPLAVLREPGSARYGGRCHGQSHRQSLLPTEPTASLLPSSDRNVRSLKDKTKSLI